MRSVHEKFARESMVFVQDVLESVQGSLGLRDNISESLVKLEAGELAGHRATEQAMLYLENVKGSEACSLPSPLSEVVDALLDQSRDLRTLGAR